MITSVTGQIRAVGADSVVVAVGGFGVRMLCPKAVATGLRVGQQVELAASLVVREDSLTMYGFIDDDQRGVFELLQSVSGFGPKIALAVLSTLTSDELRAAVTTGDERALTAIPGIGRKGAQRLLLELGDKLGPSASQHNGHSASTLGAAVDVREGGGVGPASENFWRGPVREALIGLGWSAREAEAAVTAVAAGSAAAAEASQVGSEAGPIQSAVSSRDVVAVKLKLALRTLGRS